MPIFNRLKNKIREKLKYKVDTSYVPSDIQDVGAPIHEHNNFVEIDGNATGPNGQLGAYALANGKSGDVGKYPLPREANNPKSVFFANGMTGLVKSMGGSSVIVELPGLDPRGDLWHLHRGDLKQRLMPDQRKKPLQARLGRNDGLTITSAGVVDLKGLADTLTEPLAREVHRVLSELEKSEGYGERAPNPDEHIVSFASLKKTGTLDKDHAREISRNVSSSIVEVVSAQLRESAINKNFWSLLGGYYSEPVLSTEKAEKRFSGVWYRLDATTVGRTLGHFEPSYTGSVVIFVRTLIEALIKANGSYAPTYRAVHQAFSSTIAHELRHAADWAYQESGRPDGFMQETGPFYKKQKDPNLNSEQRLRVYLNTPTELKSWAGNVAQEVWSLIGKTWRESTGDELYSWMLSADERTMERIAPENKRAFIQRVIKALQQLEADNDRRIQKSRERNRQQEEESKLTLPKTSKLGQKITLDLATKNRGVYAHDEEEDGEGQVHRKADARLGRIRDRMLAESRRIRGEHEGGGDRDVEGRNRGRTGYPYGLDRDSNRRLAAINDRAVLVRQLTDAGFHNEGGTRHDVFRHKDGRWTTVPRHRVLKMGTARSILRVLKVAKVASLSNLFAGDLPPARLTVKAARPSWEPANTQETAAQWVHGEWTLELVPMTELASFGMYSGHEPVTNAEGNKGPLTELVKTFRKGLPVPPAVGFRDSKGKVTITDGSHRVSAWVLAHRKDFSNLSRVPPIPVIIGAVGEVGLVDKKATSSHLTLSASFHLIAGRLDDVKMIWRKKFPDEAKYVAEVEPVITALSQRDPTGQNAYLAWMVNMVLGPEKRDQNAVVDLATRFETQKKRLPKEYRDINKLDFFTTEYVVEQTESEKTHSKTKEEVTGGSELIAQTPEYKVYEIHNKEASCALGRGTKWCITMRDKKFYEDYVSRGIRFFFIFDKSGEKHAVAAHPSKGALEVYNAEDDLVSTQELPKGSLDSVYAKLGYHPESAKQQEEEAEGLTGEETNEDSEWGSFSNKLEDKAEALINNPYTNPEVLDRILEKIESKNGRIPTSFVKGIVARPTLSAYQLGLITKSFDDQAKEYLVQRQDVPVETIMGLVKSNFDLAGPAMNNPIVSQGEILKLALAMGVAIPIDIAKSARNLSEEAWKVLAGPEMIENAAPLELKELLKFRNRPEWATRAILTELRKVHERSSGHFPEMEGTVPKDIAEDFVRNTQAWSAPLLRSEDLSSDAAFKLLLEATEVNKVKPTPRISSLVTGFLTRPDVTEKQYETIVSLPIPTDKLSIGIRDASMKSSSRAVIDGILAQASTGRFTTTLASNPNLTEKDIDQLYPLVKAPNYNDNDESLLDAILNRHSDKLSPKALRHLLTVGPIFFLKKAPGKIPASELIKLSNDKTQEGIVQKLAKEEIFNRKGGGKREIVGVHALPAEREAGFEIYNGRFIAHGHFPFVVEFSDGDTVGADCTLEWDSNEKKLIMKPLTLGESNRVGIPEWIKEERREEEIEGEAMHKANELLPEIQKKLEAWVLKQDTKDIVKASIQDVDFLDDNTAFGRSELNNKWYGTYKTDTLFQYIGPYETEDEVKKALTEVREAQNPETSTERLEQIAQGPEGDAKHIASGELDRRGVPGYNLFDTLSKQSSITLTSRVTLTANFDIIAGRLDDVKAIWKKKYPDERQFASDIAPKIDALASQDPSGANKYLAWMADQVLGKNKAVEDVVSLVNRFHTQLARLPKDYRDLSKLDFFDAEYVVERAEETKTHSERKKEVSEGATLLTKTPNYSVYEIKNKEASCALGAGTKWCITMRDKNFYEDYVEAGTRFFFILSPNGEKHAVAADKEHGALEIYNSNDDLVGVGELPEGSLSSVYAAIGHSQEKATALEGRPLNEDYESPAGIKLKRMLTTSELTNFIREMITNPYVKSEYLDQRIKALSEEVEFIPQDIVSKLAMRPTLTPYEKKLISSSDSPDVLSYFMQRRDVTQEDVIPILHANISLASEALKNPNVNQIDVLELRSLEGMEMDMVANTAQKARSLAPETWSWLVGAGKLEKYSEEGFSDLLRAPNRPAWATQAILEAQGAGSTHVNDIRGEIPADVAKEQIASGRNWSPALMETPSLSNSEAWKILKPLLTSGHSFLSSLLRGFLRRPDATKEQVEEIDQETTSREAVRVTFAEAASTSSSRGVIEYFADADNKDLVKQLLNNKNLTEEDITQIDKNRFFVYPELLTLLLKRHADKISANVFRGILKDSAAYVLKLAPSKVPTASLKEIAQEYERGETAEKALEELWKRKGGGERKLVSAKAYVDFEIDFNSWGTVRIPVRVEYNDGTKFTTYVDASKDAGEWTFSEATDADNSLPTWLENDSFSLSKLYVALEEAGEGEELALNSAYEEQLAKEDSDEDEDPVEGEEHPDEDSHYRTSGITLKTVKRSGLQREAQMTLEERVSQFLKEDREARSCSTVKGSFDKCKPTAKRLAEFLGGEVVKVNAPEGMATDKAHPQWQKLVKSPASTAYFTHYVVLVDSKVVDLTARQFDSTAPFPLIVDADTFFSTWKRTGEKLTLASKLTLQAARSSKSSSLVAMHNLNEGNLLHAQEVGGLISPSIAITKSSQSFENFGDITLVAPMSLIDPTTTPVFDADIYSARYPSVRHKPNVKEIDKLRKTYEDYIKRTDSYFDDAENAVEKDGGEGLLRRSSLPALQLAFLEQVKGLKVDAPVRDKPVELEWARAPTLQQFFSEHGYDRNARPGDPYWMSLSEAAKKSVEEFWLNAKSEGLDEEDRKYLIDSAMEYSFHENQLNFNKGDKLFNSHQNIGQTEMDKFGYQEKLQELIKPYEAEFQTWAKEILKTTQGAKYLTSDGGKKMPYNPENVLKLMTKKLKGAENFNYGLGSLRALGATRFRSLDQMEKAQNKIVTKEEFDAVKSKNQEEFFALLDKLRSYHPAGDNMRFSSTLMSSIGESYKRGRSLLSELKKDGFETLPPDLVQEIDRFRRDLVNMPTEYFEAKPQRLVGLNEFSGAVVPKDASPQVLSVLQANGLNVVFYDKTKPATRAKAIAKLQRGNVTQRKEGITLKALKKPDKNDGEKAGIFLRLPPELAKDFPTKTEDLTPPHFTLLYLGGSKLNDLPQMETILTSVLTSIFQFTVTLSPGIEWFQNDEGKWIAHKGVDEKSAQIMEILHNKLRRAFEAEGFSVEHKEGYIPHATLDYCDEKKYDGKVPEGSFRVANLELWGWTKDVEVPLQIKKVSFLIDEHSLTLSMSNPVRRI